MKRFLLILCAVASLSLASSAESHIARTRSALLDITRANGKVRWLPGFADHYSWNCWTLGEERHWTLTRSEKYSYDDDGKIMSLTTQFNSTEYSYDDLGRVTQSLYYRRPSENEEMELHSISSYQYDPILEDFVVLETVQTSSKGGWTTESYGTEITRDDAGNITGLRDFTKYWDWEYAPVLYEDEELVVRYGDDGKANEMFRIDHWNGRETISGWIKDITWENTDGQILGVEISDFDWDSFFGANRIKSAVLMDKYHVPARMDVDYDGDAFLIKTFIDEDLVYSCDYRPLDDHGSNVNDVYRVVFDNPHSSEIYEIDYTETIHDEDTYDSYGLRLNETYRCEKTDRHGEVSVQEGYYRWQVTYDPTYGYPVEHLCQMYSQDVDEYVNYWLWVFGDYVSVPDDSPVNPVTAPADGTEYFSLQGIKVSKPSSGIYIVRQGAKTFKTAM